MTLPPDARLRPPRRALPRATVDTHAHIFDRPERYTFSGERKYSPPLCTREAWIALHASLRVEARRAGKRQSVRVRQLDHADLMREHPSRFPRRGDDSSRRSPSRISSGSTRPASAPRA